jgi:hypothetical protein
MSTTQWAAIWVLLANVVLMPANAYLFSVNKRLHSELTARLAEVSTQPHPCGVLRVASHR